VWRVRDAARARFVPDDIAEPSRAARLVERASAALSYIDQPMLASTNGGPIAVTEDSGQRLKPRDGLYRFRFVAPIDRRARTALIQPVQGRLVIDAEGTSLIGRFVRSVLRIWRGEASLT
jgi:putative peptide zinc metalloprotease protein